MSHHPTTLDITAPGDTEIVMTRAFDAPRHLVFEALTRPELITRWLTGPPGNEMLHCEVDLRVGGAYRYVWRNSSGDDMGAGGVFTEIVVPERLVCTESFDDPWYEGEALIRYELFEHGDHTLLSATMTYGSRAARDVALASGMDSGVRHSYEQLDDLVHTMATSGTPD